MLVPRYCFPFGSKLTEKQYLLDDDVECHNEAEPVTTKCPLLPGQPVNVLHVPVILPDSRTHSREDSISSQKSNYRTMNPEDKYLNPRQAPKPKLRLRTSPKLSQQPTTDWPFRASPLGSFTRSTSQPSSATRANNGHERSVSSSKPARSLSPPRSRGVRSVFQHLNSSLSDIDRTNGPRGDAVEPVQGYGSIPSRGGNGHHMANRSVDRLPFQQSTPTGNTGNTALSIQDRRAQSSKSRGTSPSKNPLRLETQLGNGKPSKKRSQITQPSPEPKLSPSRKVSSLIVTAAKKLGTSRDSITPKPPNPKEKRLPTLPNSPSSVMDEELRDLDARERALDMEMLCSHFSAITTTEGSNASDSPCERSRFSEWSTDSDAISPESMTSSSTFNPENYPSPASNFSDAERPSRTAVPGDFNDPRTPRFAATSNPTSPISRGHTSPIDKPLPHLSDSESSPRIDIPYICVDDVDHVESNPKRHAAFFGGMDSIKGLGLVRSPDASATTFSDGVKRDMSDSNDSRAASLTDNDDRISSIHGYEQSATMKEMMDELSYLKNMIESGA